MNVPKTTAVVSTNAIIRWDPTNAPVTTVSLYTIINTIAKRVDVNMRFLCLEEI